MSIGPTRKRVHQVEEQVQIPAPGRSSGVTRVRKGQPMATHTLVDPPSVAAVLPPGKNRACAERTSEVFLPRDSSAAGYGSPQQKRYEIRRRIILRIYSTKHLLFAKEGV